MPFYDLLKEQRINLVATITNNIFTELKISQLKKTTAYFGDEDTYIRKTAYLSIGKNLFRKQKSAIKNHQST